MIRISSVENIYSKEKIVRSILKDLPEYFGIEENIKDYTDNAKGYPLWVAFDGALALGFISLKKTSEFTAEIYCMGIKEEYHVKIFVQSFTRHLMHTQKVSIFMNKLKL